LFIAQFAVDSRKIDFDRLWCDEKRRGDVVIVHSGSGQFGDASLRGSQAGGAGAAGGTAVELDADLFGPQWCPDLLEDQQRLVQHGGGCAPVPQPSFQPAENEKRSRAFERHVKAIMVDQGALGVRHGGSGIAARG